MTYNISCYKKINILKQIVIPIFICLFTLLNPCISHGNSPPLVMQGSTAFPINSDYIVLEKEVINIHYGKEEHHVEVVFHFHNMGPETDLQIGFPNVANYGETLYDFKVFQHPDGTEYEVQEKPGGILPGLDQYMYEKMFAWTMHFKEGERKALLVTYSYYNTTLGEDDGGFANYILETGALWKDKIGSIDIYVDFPEKAAYPEITASPSGYRYNGEGIEWHFENIEPDFNLNISYQKLPDNLKLDWMYEPRYNKASSDYKWNDRIFVPDLFERWNLDEDPLINPYSELDLREETEKLIGNCLLVKNEILARHGALLSDEWSAFFSQFPWYEPRSNFSEDELNETEKLNLKLIEIYLKHILPNADEESFTAKFQALLDKYGDAFFRHFPVLNREENRETIQKFIEQRLEVWEPYNPLHLGQCEPGYVKSPAALNKIEGTNYENIYLLGQTENGFSIFHATDDKILLEKDGTFYEIYQKIASGNIMYERYYDTPCKNAFLLHLEFHDHEIEDIMKKWCREVKNTVTGTVLNPLDDLLVLPETGEKYVLSGLDIYAINHVWSENGHLFAYPCEISGVPYLQVIDIKNRHLMKYTLPENCKCREIIVLNDGSGFLRSDNTVFHFSPGTGLLERLHISGQFIDYDYTRKSLIYVSKNEIRQYTEEGNDSIAITVPKEIWKVEKQDQDNYVLYCHHEYYYIYNIPNQTTYRYQHHDDYYDVLIHSPSGMYRLERYHNRPLVITTGNTNERRELNVPYSMQYEWFSDTELVLSEIIYDEANNARITFEHIYDAVTGEKITTLLNGEEYTENNTDETPTEPISSAQSDSVSENTSKPETVPGTESKAESDPEPDENKESIDVVKPSGMNANNINRTVIYIIAGLLALMAAGLLLALKLKLKRSGKD